MRLLVSDDLRETAALPGVFFGHIDDGIVQSDFNFDFGRQNTAVSFVDFSSFFFNDEQAHEVVFNGIPNDVKNLLRTGYEYKCSTLLIEVVRRAARGRHANKYPFLSYKLKIL